MMTQLFSYLGSSTEDFFNWCTNYWTDFGIIISILTAVLLGVATAIDTRSNEVIPGLDASPHAEFMEFIFVVGMLTAWVLPLILIALFWAIVCTLPVTIGHTAATLYKNHKDSKVTLPKASIEREIQS